MRLSDQQVKRGILHPDREVRDAAAYYFSQSFAPDAAMMPEAIEAIEKYGWREAFSEDAFLDDLVQTPRTIRWVLAELRGPGREPEDAWQKYCSELSLVLSEADVDVLAREEKLLAAARWLDAVVRDHITQRLSLRTADPEDAWRQLEAFDQRHRESETTEADLDHAYRLIEVAARSGDRVIERMMRLLESRETDAQDSHPSLMELFAVRLAGELRHGEAAPHLVRRLRDGFDWLGEECTRALARIGNDTIADAVADIYSNEGPDFRLRAAAVLESIHSDRSVAQILSLLDREDDAELQIRLAQAALFNFSSEAIEPARRLVLENPPSRGLIELREDLLTVCRLMDADFPERGAWEREIAGDREFSEQFQSPDFPVVDNTSGYMESAQRRSTAAKSSLPKRLFIPERVGRNDPCPCGSGKKFKKCCWTKMLAD